MGCRGPAGEVFSEVLGRSFASLEMLRTILDRGRDSSVNTGARARNGSKDPPLRKKRHGIRLTTKWRGLGSPDGRICSPRQASFPQLRIAGCNAYCPRLRCKNNWDAHIFCCLPLVALLLLRARESILRVRALRGRERETETYCLPNGARRPSDESGRCHET
jgi:hypothetical protein